MLLQALLAAMWLAAAPLHVVAAAAETAILIKVRARN
jgi:hypothetical protein